MSIAPKLPSPTWAASSAASSASLKISAGATSSYWKPLSSIVPHSWLASSCFACSPSVCLRSWERISFRKWMLACFACMSGRAPACAWKKRLASAMKSKPFSGINLSYASNGTIGTSDVEILIALDPEHHTPTAALIRHLREILPQRFPGVEFFFQPADIVTQILNFGLPAPIDVQVVGTDMGTSYVIAQQIANKMRHIPGTADVHVQQLLSLPTIHMDIDRTRTTQVGLQARDVAQSVLVSLSGSFQTSPNFWLNPRNEVTYQMAVQAPQYRMTSMQDLMTIPVTSQQGPQLLSNLVQVYPVARAATVNHYNVAPVIDVYASTQDRDLGAVAADTMKVLKTFDNK